MKILPAILMLLAVVPAHAGTTMRYTVLFQGKPGAHRRPRWPTTVRSASTTAIATTAAVPISRKNSRWQRTVPCFDMLPKAHRRSGAPIHDSFTRRGNHAEWESQSDQRQGQRSGPGGLSARRTVAGSALADHPGRRVAVRAASRGAAGRRAGGRENGRPSSRARGQDP